MVVFFKDIGHILKLSQQNAIAGSEEDNCSCEALEERGMRPRAQGQLWAESCSIATQDGRERAGTQPSQNGFPGFAALP